MPSRIAALLVLLVAVPVPVSARPEGRPRVARALLELAGALRAHRASDRNEPRLTRARAELRRSWRASAAGRLTRGVADGVRELAATIKAHPIKATLICAGLYGACILGDSFGLPASQIVMWGSLGLTGLRAARSAIGLHKLPAAERPHALGRDVVWPALMVGSTMGAFSRLPAAARATLNSADDVISADVAMLRLIAPGGKRPDTRPQPDNRNR